MWKWNYISVFFFPWEKNLASGIVIIEPLNYTCVWQITQETEKLRTFAIKIMSSSVNYVLITLSIPQIYRA